ncbi:[NU+] prion formation protein 1 [Acrodontium crateriforme]|uniref:[NU+] prion formation protein 1 n=1 Tax=Acrodontium crateriforme TaxID=150365 RepID=A0AAQ3M886_9PEZI|nr:[NU+] prion formation protein 1 [Acrodontium crateriforme]
MQLSTIVVFLSASLVASAVPTSPISERGSGSTQQCGNGQVLSCCNTGVSILSVLGGSCELAILGQGCAGNQAFCCDATQNGLINLGSICAPITL